MNNEKTTTMIGKEILNYRITGILGQGGMGTVYVGVNKFIQEQKVAIKVINHDMLNDFTRQRLEEEAHRLASLNHPNIVKLINFHKDEKGSVYLIMECAEGVSIEKFIRDINGLVVVDRICPLFEPILDGIASAHNHKTKNEDGKLVPDPIIHCDIKPSNIVITPDKDQKIKILDFGIAQIVNEQDGSTNMIMGTPSYMSPEQIRGEKLDTRSDIYSLGVMLHQMLTGNVPYDTTTLTEQQINQKVIEEPLPRMATYYKYIPEKIQKIVDKATAKNPKDRYQTCEEFKKALHNAIYPPKMPLWSKIAAIAAAVIVVGVVGFVWDYNRVKTYYYKDYVEQWGVPQGLGELSSSEHSHASRSYKFVYQRGKLLRVSHINSLDNIIDDGESERNERPIDQELYYADNGNLNRVKVKDRSGKVLYVKSYNEKLTVMAFQYDDEHNTERVLSNSTVGYGRTLEANSDNRGRISRWWIEYDEDGYVVSEKYHSLDNSAVGDENGIYGRTYVRDDKGRAIEIHYIGMDGKPQPTKWGLGIKKLEYDDDDNWVKATYLTVDGKAAFDDTDGTSVYKLEYDDYGNVVTAFQCDGTGEPMLPKKNGFSGAHYTYDKKGMRIQMDVLDTDNQLMFEKSMGCAIVKYEYDENGYENKRTFCDTKGTPVLTKEGNAITECKNDEHGNNVEQWYKDTKGNLCESTSGYAGGKAEYDSIGNMTKVVYYDTNKKPAILDDGVTGLLMKYNEFGQKTQVTNLGKDLKPAPDNDGIIIGRVEYDKRGNDIKYSYYEADGKTLRLNSEGVAGWTYAYDETGALTEMAYFDTKGNPALSLSDHFAKMKVTYDENGNRNSLRYYDANDKLTLVDGIAGNDYKNDKRGNVLEEKPVGLNNELAAGKLISKYKYDAFANQTEHALYDKSGAAVNKFGIHRYVYVYNSRNQIVEQRNYGTNGQLVVGTDNGSFAIQKNEFDAMGNRIKTSFFGTDSKPMVCEEGWSSSKYEYDNYGNIIKQSFFGVDSKPTDPSVMVPVGICKYNKNNNIIYIAAQDGKGHFIINPNTGWAIRRSEYDAKSNLIFQSVYDANDKPMIGPDGYHKITYKYDENDNQTEEAYFDTKEKPMSVEGVHMEKTEYNAKGQITSMSTYNQAGKPVDNSVGYQKMTVAYKDDIPAVRKYYCASGSLFATQTYDASTGNWTTKMASAAGSPSGSAPMANNASSASSSWHQAVQEANAECPLNCGNGVYLQSITASGNSVTVVFKLMEVSKYDMTEEQNKNISSVAVQTANEMKRAIDAPSNIAVHVKIVDKANRLIYSK